MDSRKEAQRQECGCADCADAGNVLAEYGCVWRKDPASGNVRPERRGTEGARVMGTKRDNRELEEWIG